MKIVHINTHDAGGAAIASFRLHKSLLNHGIDSNYLVLYRNFKYVNEDKVFYFLDGISRKNKVFFSIRYKIIFWINKLIHLFLRRIKIPFSAYNLWDHPLVQSADIIHLHWVCDFLDYSSFFKPSNKKIVWTLHDENPYSYGYNYEADIEKGNKIIAKYLKKYKQQIFSRNLDLTIVCPSKWIMNRSLDSNIFSRFKHIQIPNGVDSNIFYPVTEKSTIVNERNGVRSENFLIVSVSQDINNKIKGFKFLIDAFQGLNLDMVKLVLVGNANIHFPNIIYLGTINSELELAEIYRSADLFVIPSIMDNSPNTIIEALMCGLPVIGFNAGGVPEGIVDTKGGIVLKEVNENVLMNSLLEIFENRAVYEKLKSNASLNSKKYFDIKVVTLKYLEQAYA